MDLILWRFGIDFWSLWGPKIILLLSRSLTSYKNATWIIYRKLQYNIQAIDLAYRHIIFKKHQTSIPKSNFFLVSILDHFLSLLVAKITPIDIQIDQQVTILELRNLTFRDSFADSVPKRSRIDFGAWEPHKMYLKIDQTNDNIEYDT